MPRRSELKTDQTLTRHLESHFLSPATIDALSSVFVHSRQCSELLFLAFVFLIHSPGICYVGFGTNRIGSLVFFWKKDSAKHWLEQWGPCQFADDTQAKIALKATQFTGQWRESNASSSCSALRSGCSTNTATRRLNDTTSDSELQSSDSEDPDDSEDDAQSDTSEVSDFIEHSYEALFVPDTDVECVTVQNK